MSKAPIRIGLIQDWGTTRPFIIEDHYQALELGFADALSEGVLDRPVELVIREQEAYPHGNIQKVIEVWKEMEQDSSILAVIGPQVAQANIPLRDLVNQAGFPMLSHCATDQFYGEYCFVLPNGFFPDEVHIVAQYIKKRGLKTIGVIYDDNDQGNESFALLPLAIRRAGLEIVHAEQASPMITDIGGVLPHLERLRQAKPDALVYLGNAYLLRALTPAIKHMKWDVPRVTTTTYVGMLNYFRADAPSTLDGWTGMDQHDERNTYFRSVLDRFEARHGRRPAHTYTAIGYDFARLTAEAIALAPNLTREGVKLGYEKIRMLPAAAGAEGNVSSFSRYDHRCYKGRYLVWRTMRDGRDILVE
ncbi:MAG: ABC transporter substrate-binding protein [Steroidobacteraceae bacterium]